MKPRGWVGIESVLAGLLFGAWGFAHRPMSAYDTDVVVHVLSLVVPLLFMVGLVNAHRRRASPGRWLERAGFVICMGGVTLALLYRVLEWFDFADAASRYALLASNGIPPRSLDWLSWLFFGLVLMGIGSINTMEAPIWGPWPLVMGCLGLAYHLSDSGSRWEAGWAHIVFGMLFSLSWVALGWSERKETRCPKQRGTRTGLPPVIRTL